MSDVKELSKFAIWMQVVRPFAFTASITPVLLGTALAFFETGRIHFVFFIAAMAGGVLLHAGTNLVSEYWDYVTGADKFDTFGDSRILVNNLLNPKYAYYAGVAAFGAAFLIGIYLVYHFGMPIVALGITGIIGGYFYCGKPFGYKYAAFGEPLVGILMGPLMVLGAYFVQTGKMSWTPIWASIPVAILVAAILNANNLRDIPTDIRVGIKTIPNKLGWRPSVLFFQILVASAYVSVLGLILTKQAPYWSIIVLITVPMLLKMRKTIAEARPNEPMDLATLDISTAQLHFQFGLLLTVGFILGSLL